MLARCCLETLARVAEQLPPGWYGCNSITIQPRTQVDLPATRLMFVSAMVRWNRATKSDLRFLTFPSAWLTI